MYNHHSGSLSSLPLADQSISSRNKSSYRSSLNDTTSLESSRVIDEFGRVLLQPEGKQRQQELSLPFSTTASGLTHSNAKLTSEDEEEKCSNLSEAVIPLVDDAGCNVMGEALQLYDFGQRDERDGYNHHHHHIKHHRVDGIEGTREIREDGNEALYESGEEDEIPAEINVKKETSV